MNISLSLILDGLVIFLLVGTIFYAVRLSFHIKAFRESRKDLDSLVSALSGSIDKAEKAIGGLREGARESGRDLQVLINEARALSEELQIMNQAGDRLAGKLEKLSDKKGEMLSKGPLAGFSIHDSEFGEGDASLIDEENEGDGMEEDEDGFSPDAFSSRAERDLYEALRQNKNKNKKMTIS